MKSDIKLRLERRNKYEKITDFNEKNLLEYL
jgi:hypothetical protein